MGDTQSLELRQEQRCTPNWGWIFGAVQNGLERGEVLGLLRLRLPRLCHRRPGPLQVWFSVSTRCVATRGADKLPLGVQLPFMLSTGGAVTSPVDSSLPLWAWILKGPDIRDAVVGGQKLR